MLKELGINTDGLFKEVIIEENILQSYINKYVLADLFMQQSGVIW